MNPDEEALEGAGLLAGLEGEERDARLELLRELAAAGADLPTLQQAAAEDRLALLPFELALGADCHHTAAQTAELSGLPEQVIVNAWIALGLPRPEPEEPTFTEDNVSAARGLRELLEAGVNEEQINELARVAGRGTAQLAEAAVEVLVGALLEAGDDEQQFTLRIGQAANALVPRLAPLIEAPLRAHLHDRVRREVVGRVERSSGRLPATQDVAVCFADTVGFTQLGLHAPVRELDAVVTRLDELATHIARPPVRLVKLVGDCAMLVAPEPAALLDAALHLVEAGTDDQQLPALRAGMATGPALRRGGDWYGHTVNLASRICDAAPRGTVAATQAVREAAPQHDWTRLPETALKGIDHPVPLFAITLAASRAS